MSAYYNEIDPYAAQWLRNLIDAGHIAPGVVDTRSIEDVRPEDLLGFTQCHFFAGLGGWSLALRLAGWSDDRPAWTGSCPCQPFSAAGKGAGFADERHLWPSWQHLIAQCQPPVIFGEQVASKAVEPWIDLVHADLEGMGYAFGCVPYPAAGIGAPHIRDRTYWVAYAYGQRLHGKQVHLQPGTARFDHSEATRFGGVGELANTSGERLAQRERIARVSGESGGADTRETAEQGSIRAVVGMADASSEGRRSEWKNVYATHSDETFPAGQAESGRCSAVVRPSPTNGQWRTADWLQCRDGKWRPVEPGTQPLAHGISGRVGRLRAYGNAIVPQQAAEFVQAYCEAVGINLTAMEQAA